jgi:hypothetical protein
MQQVRAAGHFMRHVRRSRSKDTVRLIKKLKEMKANSVRTAFTRADDDKSGGLDQEEFRHLLVSMFEHSNVVVSMEVAYAIFAEVDVNSDGDISVEEFIGYCCTVDAEVHAAEVSAAEVPAAEIQASDNVITDAETLDLNDNSKKRSRVDTIELNEARKVLRSILNQTNADYNIM